MTKNAEIEKKEKEAIKKARRKFIKINGDLRISATDYQIVLESGYINMYFDTWDQVFNELFHIFTAKKMKGNSRILANLSKAFDESIEECRKIALVLEKTLSTAQFVDIYKPIYPDNSKSLEKARKKRRENITQNA